ncbi:NUDIX hydrolase [Parvularcula maris]|uniref:CoA pyrophosphatase n=1 Tax=Parvularcula maris TaxID=2965077 RepID=A0A9X2L9P0_9PROT|nr:CoA pyrophosphatase [Parvularcula maris]MCQ8185622.1 CoA pyrophosphatase [Parvularcula maris]
MSSALLAQLEASLRTKDASRERFLFRELNPGLPHTPILNKPPSKPRPAAVLIGVRMSDEPTVILTLRAPTMPSHAGQIALPGGMPSEGDDGFVGTAIREAEEEVGLSPSAVRVLGSYGPHHGGLGYVVTPVLAAVRGDADVVADPREVADVFEVPLASLLDLSGHVTENRQFKEVTYQMYAVPSLDTAGRHWNIWGLTAGILRTMAECMDEVA